MLVASAAVASWAWAPPASAKRVRALRCPQRTPGQKLDVYAIGSSTLGSILAPILKQECARMGARFHFWGKASSGLARPDFQDWPGVLPGLMERHHPDVLIISLGTNDGQALSYYPEGRAPKPGKKGGALRWAHLFTPEYAKIYSARVDALLAAAAGPKRDRPIIWLGPTGHPTEKYNKRMRYLRSLILKRIKAFRGDVVYLDGLSLTLDPKTGAPKARVHVPHKGDVGALQRDGMHLTTAGARWLLAEPLLRLLRPCVRGKAKVARKARALKKKKVRDEGPPAGDEGRVRPARSKEASAEPSPPLHGSSEPSPASR